MRFEDLINKHSDQLTENDTQLLSFLLRHREIVPTLTARKVSESAYSSPAGLTRLAQKLGFKGFSELRYFLQQENVETEKSAINHADTLIKDMNDTIKLMTQTDLRPLVRAIHRSRNIYLYGTDWGEKRACHLLARNFLACNLTLFTIPSITELNWILPNVSAQDLLIIISFSGENTELNDNLRALTLKGIPYISITPLSKNTLSSNAKYNLYYFSTRLSITNLPNTEYNYFSPLEFVVDGLFRYYLDLYES